MKLSLLLLVVIFGAYAATAVGEAQTTPYVSVLKEQGVEPVAFVRKALATHDLIIFDDALHSAVEPFDFYQTLLRDPEIRKMSPFVFVEVISLAAQPYLDAYLSSAVQDPALLMKVFQDDYSGYGWRYQTYLDLLSTIWTINHSLPEPERYRVIGVDQPIYWEAIHTRRDYEIFQDTLLARDYFMYRVIAEKMDDFASGKKGLFLTNTRHSYKHLRRKDGSLFWNCGTFFDQFQPGKAFSVRFHNVTLLIEGKAAPTGRSTAEGLEDIQYRWARMEDGIWDQAYREAGVGHLAIPLKDNVFGKARYVGNLMLNAREDQTMYDAYDAVIFLGTPEELHISGQFGFIYTDTFRKEVKRRVELMEEGRLDAFLKENGARTIDEFIDMLAAGEPQKKNTLAN